MPVSYPLDLTGQAPSNLITGELHTVSEAQYRDFYFLVPNLAPFFIDNFKLEITVNGTTRELVEDVDFSFCLPYIAGTRSTGKPMYGAVTLHNLDLNGVLTLQYQTVGGEYVADRLAVLTFLAEKAYNPRTTVWDNLVDVPQGFPPTPHYEDYDNYYGQEEVVVALNAIKDAIANTPLDIQNELNDFLSLLGLGDTNNKYVLKSGDSMTGPLTLSGAPYSPLHAATKKYVDDTVNAITGVSGGLYSNKVDRTGDTMTGPLLAHSGTPVDPLEMTPKSYVDGVTQSVRTELKDIIEDLSLFVNSKDNLNVLKFNELDKHLESINNRLTAIENTLSTMDAQLAIKLDELSIEARRDPYIFTKAAQHL